MAIQRTTDRAAGANARKRRLTHTREDRVLHSELVGVGWVSATGFRERLKNGMF